MSRSHQRRRGRVLMGVITTEIAAAMAVVSQMSLLSPPGFDDWIRRELAGDSTARAPHRTAAPR